MKSIKLVSLAILLCPVLALADSSYNYISGGYQGTNVSKDGMGEYLNGQYNNNEDKQLHGVYIKGSRHISGGFFIQGDMSFTTRFSTDLIAGNIALGHAFSLGNGQSFYTSFGYGSTYAKRSVSKSCGIFDDKSECRKHRTNNDESGLSAEVGYKSRINDAWEVIPSYRFTDLASEGKHDLKITNLITLSSQSALELNVEYDKWGDLDQMNYQLGYRYKF